MRRRTAALLAVPPALGAAWQQATPLGRSAYRLASAVDARRAGLTRRVVDVDGLAMSVLEGGAADGKTGGPTVLLVHGYTADATTWLRFAVHLQGHLKGFRLVIPDLAGHGETAYVPGSGYSGPAQADRLSRLLEVLGTGPVHVLGNSMGGLVSAHLALRHPAQVRSLGLSDAVGTKASAPSLVEEILERGGRNPFFVHDRADFDAFYALTMAKPPYAPRFVLGALAEDYRARRVSYEEIFADFFQRDPLDDDLHRITAPTLVVWGTEDQLVHPSAADVFAAGIAGARLITYDGVGHLPMLEIPRRLASDYRRFVDAC